MQDNMGGAPSLGQKRALDTVDTNDDQNIVPVHENKRRCYQDLQCVSGALSYQQPTIRLETLPRELIYLIWDKLDEQDLDALRLTNRNIRQLTWRYATRDKLIALKPYTMETLRQMARMYAGDCAFSSDHIDKRCIFLGTDSVLWVKCGVVLRKFYALFKRVVLMFAREISDNTVCDRLHDFVFNLSPDVPVYCCYTVVKYDCKEYLPIGFAMCGGRALWSPDYKIYPLERQVVSTNFAHELMICKRSGVDPAMPVEKLTIGFKAYEEASTACQIPKFQLMLQRLQQYLECLGDRQYVHSVEIAVYSNNSVAHRDECRQLAQVFSILSRARCFECSPDLCWLLTHTDEMVARKRRSVSLKTYGGSGWSWESKYDPGIFEKWVQRYTAMQEAD